MSHVLPAIFIGVAVCLHFSHCEWEFPEDSRSIGPSQYERTIYYGNSSSHQRSGRDILLLAKSAEDTQGATLFGVALPGLLVGGAFLSWHFGQKNG